jgi:hypothetical protein
MPKKRLFSSSGTSTVSDSDLSRFMHPPPRENSFKDAIENYMIHFEPAKFKALLLEYIVSENNSFSTIESSRLQAIFRYLNLAVSSRGCLPTYTTMANWVEAAFEYNVGLISEFLNSALSNINFSFDLWTSRRMTAFCGVTVHFCDAKGKYRSFLLALLKHASTHLGANIATTIAHIIQAFSLESKIGYI